MEPPKQETVTIWLNNKSWFSFMRIRSFKSVLLLIDYLLLVYIKCKIGNIEVTNDWLTVL